MMTDEEVLGLAREMINIMTIRAYLKLVVLEYEKSAPTVSAWADDLFIRLGEGMRNVLIIELLSAKDLHSHDGWEAPQYAANKVYKLMNELGQDTTGHAGY
jgi:hypothetical protein